MDSRAINNESLAQDNPGGLFAPYSVFTPPSCGVLKSFARILQSFFFEPIFNPTERMDILGFRRQDLINVILYSSKPVAMTIRSCS